VLDVYKNPTIERLAKQMILQQATTENKNNGTAALNA